MRGRKPKPSALKSLAGDVGHRPLKTNEPRPDPGIPSCPEHLDGPAREEWDRITIQLGRLGLLTQADRAAVAAYCSAYGRWVAAEKLVAKGILYTPKKSEGEAPGLVKVNPAVRVAHDAMILMHKFLSEFGLSPASRARLATTEDAPEDQYEAFLRGTG